jgi:uncharacterized protein YdeI (YjbR/CyaY-like superfamily)
LVHAGCPDAEETLKWGMPHFMRKGILCHMAAFKEHCAFGFWKRRLIFTDSRGKTSSDGEGMGQFGRITKLTDLPRDKELMGYLRRAVELNDQDLKPRGRRRSRASKPLSVPDYFTAALKRNRKAWTAFENFSPSHRREYVDWVTGAKRDETRRKRLATAVEWLAEGKPRNWKYMKC